MWQYSSEVGGFCCALEYYYPAGLALNNKQHIKLPVNCGVLPYGFIERFHQQVLSKSVKAFGNGKWILLGYLANNSDCIYLWIDVWNNSLF